MGLNYVVRPRESRLFRQCRRAWDFDARERQDLELTEPAQVFDFGEAIHDALDVYYFPGMWEWNREIVRPLAVAGFEKSMRRQRATYAAARDLSAEQVGDWEQHLELGADLLERYFEWALENDRFTPIQVATQFDVVVPDPADAEPSGAGWDCGSAGAEVDEPVVLSTALVITSGAGGATVPVRALGVGFEAVAAHRWSGSSAPAEWLLASPPRLLRASGWA